MSELLQFVFDEGQVIENAKGMEAKSYEDFAVISKMQTEVNAFISSRIEDAITRGRELVWWMRSGANDYQRGVYSEPVNVPNLLVAYYIKGWRIAEHFNLPKI